MRKIIIGISVLLYAVSGIITYRALTIPAVKTVYPDKAEIKTAGNYDPKPAAMTPNPATTEVPAHEEAIVLAILHSDVFLSDQVLIDEDLTDSVIKLIPKIQAYPDRRIIVEGHIDRASDGMNSSNQPGGRMDLSYLRAKAVAGILTGHGIPAERVMVIGYGDTRPVASNDTEEGRKKNRRVEIKLVAMHNKSQG